MEDLTMIKFETIKKAQCGDSKAIKEILQYYKKIIKIVKEFNDGWYRLHKPEEYDYSHTLSPVEISVAVLYNRDWGSKEIAVHLKLSERMVKKHIRDIYDKLFVTSKNELKKYLEK